MYIKQYPPQEKIKEYFNYESGQLIWKVDRHSNKVKGRPFGRVEKKGYVSGRIDNGMYKAHRLIWIYFNGEIPYGLQIDHINGIKDDNKIENLRLVTHTQNRHNTTKHDGCYFNNRNKKWTSQIGINGTRYHIGDFSTKQEAQKMHYIVKRIVDAVLGF